MTALEILLVVVLVGWVIFRRMTGQPLRQRALVLPPLILLVYGGYRLADTHLTAGDLALLVVELAIALGLGLLRGATIQVFVRDGVLWMRYRWSTLALWLVSAVVRVALMAAGAAFGTGLPGLPTLLLGLGATLLGETLLVATRALVTGAPFAPEPASRRVRVRTRVR
jgi:hypothetical protein